MTIVHIVLFKFKATASKEEVSNLCSSMLALKDKCLHHKTKKPYILSSRGGKDNSPERLQSGLTHAFISEFDSEDDRAYYLGRDPAHLEFVKAAGAIVEDIRVLDFVPGEF